MKMKYNGNDYTLLAGMSKPVAANAGNSFTKAITIENNTGGAGKIVGVVARYTAGLGDVALDIKTSKTKQNPHIAGDLALTVIGAPVDSEAFHVFPILGLGIELGVGVSVEIWLKTWAIAVPDRGVMVGLLMEEIPNQPKEIEQK